MREITNTPFFCIQVIFFFQSAEILLVTSLFSEGGAHTYNLALLPDHGTFKPASTYAISDLHNSQI